MKSSDLFKLSTGTYSISNEGLLDGIKKWFYSLGNHIVLEIHFKNSKIKEFTNAYDSIYNMDWDLSVDLLSNVVKRTTLEVYCSKDGGVNLSKDKPKIMKIIEEVYKDIEKEFKLNNNKIIKDIQNIKTSDIDIFRKEFQASNMYELNESSDYGDTISILGKFSDYSSRQYILTPYYTDNGGSFDTWWDHVCYSKKFFNVKDDFEEEFLQKHFNSDDYKNDWDYYINDYISPITDDWCSSYLKRLYTQYTNPLLLKLKTLYRNNTEWFLYKKGGDKTDPETLHEKDLVPVFNKYFGYHNEDETNQAKRQKIFK